MTGQTHLSPEDSLAPGTLTFMAAMPAVLQTLFARQSQDILGRRGREGWSPKDVLAHLISIQQPALVDRVKAMLDRDLPLLPNVDEHETLEQAGLRDRPTQELLQTFTKQRGKAMRFLESLGQEEMRRRGSHELAGEISVADAIHHMGYHDLLHLAQISNLLAEAIEMRRGAMREAFPV